MFGTIFLGLVLTATVGNGAADPGSAACAVWLKDRVTGEAHDLKTWALGLVEEYASGLPPERRLTGFADTADWQAH